MKKVNLSEKLGISADELVKLNGFEMEKKVLALYKAVSAENNEPGIDGYYTKKDGTIVKLEVKNHGLNRSSLGAVDLEKTVSENLKNLLVADLYFNVRPQTGTLEVLNKKEMFIWLMDRVVLDRDRHGKPKFKINYYERSKKQDRKFTEWGMVID